MWHRNLADRDWVGDEPDIGLQPAPARINIGTRPTEESRIDADVSRRGHGQAIDPHGAQGVTHLDHLGLDNFSDIRDKVGTLRTRNQGEETKARPRDRRPADVQAENGPQVEEAERGVGTG